MKMKSLALWRLLAFLFESKACPWWFLWRRKPRETRCLVMLVYGTVSVAVSALCRLLCTKTNGLDAEWNYIDRGVVAGMLGCGAQIEFLPCEMAARRKSMKAGCWGSWRGTGSSLMGFLYFKCPEWLLLEASFDIDDMTSWRQTASVFA